MNNDQVPEELSKLQKKLYRRDAEFPEQRSSLSPLSIDPKTTGWQSDSASEPASLMLKNKKRLTIVEIILVVAVVFFVGAVGLAGFQYFAGLNVVSGGNIDLLIEGPENINAGDTLQISVITANRNQKDLEGVRLAAVFPVGTKSADNPTQNVRELREDIGTISSGQAVTKVFKAVLYGEEKQQKQIDFTLQYRVAGSNAIFTKQVSYQALIGSSPVRVVVTGPEEINSGQAFDLNVEVTANSKTTVNDMAVVVAYPPGFTFIAAAPLPNENTAVWPLTDLDPGETVRINLTGKIDAQNDESKSFQVRAGVLADEDDRNLTAEYNLVFKTIAIRKPFVDLAINVNQGQTGDQIDSQKIIPVEITWQNTLPIEIRDAELKVLINGTVLNPSSVTSQTGHYDSRANTISWNKNDVSLGVISPGETARATFGFLTKSLLEGDGVNLSQPTIDLVATFTGTRSLGENVSEPFQIEAERSLKVNTVLQLLSRALYHTGSFSPTGPMPPKVGQETLYTIEWTVLNSTNDAKEAKLTAILPGSVRFVGQSVPAGESITYNQTDRQVVWNMNTIKAGGRREVAFRVGLTPSANQVGDSPAILENTELSAIDTFTQKVLNIEASDLDIKLTKDPMFKFNTEAKIVP